jgi:beta-alanine degradation protein BauB
VPGLAVAGSLRETRNSSSKPRCSSPGVRQDSDLVGSAHSAIAVDDERVRVTTWTFAADGENTGWQVHEYDYVIVPVTGGTFAVAGPDGDTRELAQEAGEPYLGHAGTEHDVVNASGGPARFVEIELKG